jgi:hypothetical protein
LPYVVEQRVVAALARNERYAGSFDDVDVSVLRLSYSIENLRLVKRNGQVPVPFVIAPRVEYAIDQMALLRLKIGGTIEISSPSLNLVDGPTPELRQGPTGVDWRVTMRKLFPTSVNRIGVHDGTIHFRNFHSVPEVDVYLDHVDLAVSNLSLRGAPASGGTVGLHGRGVPMKGGSIVADVELHRDTRRPTFVATVSVHEAQIAEWNSLLRAYAGLDVERGLASIEVALNARDGELEGHLTPTLSEVKVLDLSKELVTQSVLTSLEEGLIDAFAAAFSDGEADVIHADIPISGTIRNPKYDDWASVRELVRHTVLDALKSAGGTTEVVRGVTSPPGVTR